MHSAGSAWFTAGEARPGVIRLAVDDPRWEAFVSRRSAATPFHHPSWAATLSAVYGYRVFCLALPDGDGEIAAGLPIIEVAHRLSRPKWVALPFTDSCPPLSVDDGSWDELAAALESERRASGIRQLEVRAALDTPEASSRVAGFLHTVTLKPDPQTTMGGFTSQARRNIAKAEREGVVIRTAESLRDVAEVFYRLHLETRRRQGVPVQPKGFFRALWSRILEPRLGFCLLAYLGDLAIAGAVFLAWNRTVIYKYGASNPSYLSLRPNNLIFWRAIEWSCENGFVTFDLGRTDPDNHGLRRFKDAWGGTEEKLVYSVLGESSTSDRVPHRKGRTMIRALIRHSPAAVCRLAGETLYRYAA